MNIGSTIKSYRKKIGLTQEQVAAAVGVSKPAVSKWEMALNHLSHNALLLHRYDEALDAAKQLPQEKVETEILLATIYFHRGDYKQLCYSLRRW